ncbi:MAG: hypothetical protein H5T86_02455 [Armatimonadetes bacterium]|nr:hypothetical protein [Armatimonadota bacterium]
MASQVSNIVDHIRAAGPASAVMDSSVYERIMRAANFDEPDRVPIWDFIDSWPIYQHFAPGETDAVVATAKVFNGLGIDLCRSVYMPLPDGAPAHNEHFVSSGLTRWYVNKPIRSLDDLRQFEVPEISDEQAAQWVLDYVKARDVFAPQTLLVPCDGVGFHAAYGTMGLELFSYAIYDAPEHVERLIAGYNDQAAKRAEVFASIDPPPCPLFIYGDDIAFKGRAMFSPDIMHRLFYPRLERLCGILSAAGVKVIFHTDGHIMDIVDDLLACGIAGINPIEPLAGNDIGELKRRYGEGLILVGNVDCSQLLPLGTPAQIREGVRQTLIAAGRGGGLFIGSSSEIVPTTPVENIFAFYQACHELGRYPLGGRGSTL